MNSVFAASYEARGSMTDLFLGLVFVAMILAPAVIASVQWSSYAVTESESLSEECGLSGIAPDES
jgi:hypothetical protein